MRSFAKRMMLATLNAFGFTVSRQAAPLEYEPPPIFEDPLDALHFHAGGKRAAFHCPLEQIRHTFAFSFSALGWHPFVAVLQEYGAGLVGSYEESVLQAFYDAWQPSHADEAIAGFARHAPPAFHRLPSRDAYVKPWVSHTIEDSRERFETWYREDYAQYGWAFDPAVHGDKAFGPVHADLGKAEYARLTGVLESIRANGYDRRLGDVGVEILKRGSEFLFLKWGGGMHRTAAMAALGYETVPATFNGSRAAIFDVAHVEHWPNVRSGLWTREAAVRYVDHLFDFDSRSWAAERGLLLEQRHRDWRRPVMDVRDRTPGDVLAGGHE
jgi:hypothetical protein